MRPIQASGDERRAIMHQRASGVTVSGLIAVSPRPFISSSPQAPSQGGALLGSPTLTCSPLCDARQFHHAIGDSPTLLLQAPRAWTRTCWDVGVLSRTWVFLKTCSEEVQGLLLALLLPGPGTLVGAVGICGAGRGTGGGPGFCLPPGGRPGRRTRAERGGTTAPLAGAVEKTAPPGAPPITPTPPAASIPAAQATPGRASRQRHHGTACLAWKSDRPQPGQ